MNSTQDIESRHRDPTIPTPSRYKTLSPPKTGLAKVARASRLRLYRKVNLPELARAAVIPYPTVHSALTGRRPRVSFRVGMRLAAALGVSPLDMLGILSPQDVI